jgi:hypothetical protein
MKTENISRITGSRAVGRSKNLREHILVQGLLKETVLLLDRPKSEGAIGPPAPPFLTALGGARLFLAEPKSERAISPPAPPFPTALGGTRLFLAEASSLKMQKVGKSGH